jgi:hypothetical protein
MRFILTNFAFALMLVFMAQPAVALPPPRYEIPSLQNMTDFLFTNGFVNPDDQQDLVDYVMIKDCKLYMDYYKDDFAWNRIRNRIHTDAKSLQNDITTHFIISNSIAIERYNFVTKAFDLSPESQLRNVNIMPLYHEQDKLCPGANFSVRLEKLPSRYDLKLDAPLSLYRVPMAEDMGRRILPDMVTDNVGNGKGRIFYMLVYVTTDSVLDIATIGSAMLLGRVEKIEFFLDQARTQKFKTLYYEDL